MFFSTEGSESDVSAPPICIAAFEKILAFQQLCTLN